MKRFYLTLLILGFSLLELRAQTREGIGKARLKEFKNNPVWIDMMNDPNADYNEAVVAFEEFWKGKPEPEEAMRGGEEAEGEEEHEHEERSIISRLFKSEKKEREEIVSYALDYKKFKYWQRKNAAYVKPDGRVMSQEEIQALIDQELRNRNQ